MTTFDTAVALVLQHEGGYVSDPSDPGGETNFGISKRAYPHLDIKNMTRDEAIEIYRRDWWEKYPMDKVPPEIAPKLFDAMVNMGPSRAITCLQRALRAETGGRFKVEDGDLKTETLSELGFAETTELLAAFRSELAGFYRQQTLHNSNLLRFLNGWLNRAYA